jgi:LysM repeat protein
MSSIRPLVTIIILVAVGAFLYVKINEGPVAPPVPGEKETAQSQSPEDVPPLAATSGAPAVEASTAPLWPATAAAVPAVSAAEPSTVNVSATDALAPPLANSATADVAAGTPPAVPAIPELPAMPATTNAASTAANSELPDASSISAGVPTARYPDDTTPPATNVTAPNQIEAAPAEVVQADVRRIFDALNQGDLETVIQFTYPKIVDLLGGPAQAKTTIGAIYAQLKSADVAPGLLTFPSEPTFLKTASHEFAIVPTKRTFVANGAQFESLHYQFGIRDAGATGWKYIDGSQINKQNVASFFPEFPADCPFPPIEVKALAAAESIAPVAESNPLRPSGSDVPEGHQNAAAVAPADASTVAASSAPIEASFAASWPAIQSALERGDLAQAHQLLSPWHGEPSLTPIESENVERLLGQLAGTVIYSTEHRLQPARIVKPGESLETIAKEYNVPWQLLAKINGIPGVDQLRPGQELKVVPGPFSAIVDLGRSELTLQVAGRYAGKFPVTVPIGATVSEGEWLVDQKLVAPASGVTQSAYTTAPPTVDHAIVLRSESEAAAPTGGPTLAIASSSTPTAPGASAAAIQVSAANAEELSDILSIGSRIIIRR